MKQIILENDNIFNGSIRVHLGEKFRGIVFNIPICFSVTTKRNQTFRVLIELYLEFDCVSIIQSLVKYDLLLVYFYFYVSKYTHCDKKIYYFSFI